MAVDSTNGAENPAVRAEILGLSQENIERIPLDTTVEGARRVAAKLLLNEQIVNMPGLSPEKHKELEMQTNAITMRGEYLDALAATMNERLQKEGAGIKKKFIDDLVEDKERGRNAMLNRLEGLNGLTEKDKKDLRKIIGHFALAEDSEDGKSYLTRWLNRDATNGYLVQEDYPVFQRIAKNAPKGAPEEKFLADLDGNFLKLRKMDPQNLTFIRSTPTMNPGGRFMLSLLLGGIALLSLLMARKSGRIPKKGLIALGLLLYIHRNPDSKLSALSSSRYEDLTKGLRGSPEGKAVIEALGDHNHRGALKDFAKREKQRQTLPPAQRNELLDSKKSMDELIGELGLKDGAAAKLRSMPVAEILALGRTLQKFNAEELEIAGEYAKEDVSKGNTADLKIEEPEKA